MASQIDGISTMMRRNQLSSHEYIQMLTQLHQGYNSNIQAAARTGDRKRQQLLTLKKEIVVKEVIYNKNLFLFILGSIRLGNSVVATCCYAINIT